MQSDAIARLLPAVFQQTLTPWSPLAAILQVMSALLTPAEQALADLPASLDPRRTPERFLRMLASWVNMDYPVTTGQGHVRELVAAAADLERWRGTRAGLTHYLEWATGIDGFHVATEPLRAFHFQVRAPRTAEKHQPMIQRIIEREKPAYATYELIFE